MPLLKTLVSQTNWPEIAAMIQKYPGKRPHSLNTYQTIFLALQKMAPLMVDDCEIVIQKSANRLPTVSGKMLISDTTNDPEWGYFSLALTPWREWLGMNIDPQTYQEYAPAEIVAYCLLAMTQLGKDESEINQIYQDWLLRQIASLKI